jgi:hypothetical protein
MVKHALAPQTNGAQLVGVVAGQLPAPSHELAELAVPLAQLAARH